MSSGDKPTAGQSPAHQLGTVANLLLSDGMDISAQTVVGATFEDQSAQRAFFADSIFRQCVFTRCKFARGDFEATIFEGCEFRDCDFSSSDFRSAEFAGCTIVNCRFPNGSVTATSFIRCQLENCKFYRQSFDENRFSDCELNRCSFHRATLLHLTFEGCRFIRTDLADCTSLYHLFDKCSFTKSRINVDSVPLTFGLTRANLSELSFVWQGRRQLAAADIGKFLDDLVEALAARRWAVAACILAINFALTPTIKAFELAFAGIMSAVSTGRPVRADELRFLAKVVETLSQRRELPFLAIIEGLDFCVRAAAQDNGREERNLRALTFALKDAELAAIGIWETTWQALLLLEPAELCVEFVFDEKPQVVLLPFLRRLNGSRNDSDKEPFLIDVRVGSYIEVVSMTLGGLMAFLIALGMLVRIVDQLITLRAKGEILTKKRLPSTIRTRAMEPLPAASAGLAKEISSCLSLLTGADGNLLADSAKNIAQHVSAIRVAPDRAN